MTPPCLTMKKMLNLFSFCRVRNIRRKTKRLQHNEINLTIKTNKTNDCQRMIHRNLSNHREVYETTRKQHGGTIHTIRADALFYRPVLLERSIVDVKSCLAKFSGYRSEMLTKVNRLRNLINMSLRRLDFKHKCLKQKKKLNTHISSIHRYEHRYENSSNKPIIFS